MCVYIYHMFIVAKRMLISSKVKCSVLPNFHKVGSILICYLSCYNQYRSSSFQRGNNHCCGKFCFLFFCFFAQQEWTNINYNQQVIMNIYIYLILFFYAYIIKRKFMVQLLEFSFSLFLIFINLYITCIHNQICIVLHTS